MSLFGNLSTEGLETAGDRLGGFSTLESDIYQAKIKVAYAGKSTSSNAQSVTVIYDLGNREYRETYWITNGEGQNYFLNKQDNTKKVPLPGFTHINDLCLVTTDQPLAAQPGEEKMVNMYDPELQREAPKAVPVLVNLTGKEVYVGVIRALENKSVKNTSTNKYEPIADTRETNSTDKIFHHPTKMTVSEATNGAQEPIFFNAWLEKNKGVTRDKRTIKDGAAGGAPKSGRPGGPPQAAAGNAAPKSSLFGQK
jgi:hypothetical protein